MSTAVPLSLPATDPDEKPAAFRTDPRRWAALAQLFLLAVLNSCQWINFAAVVDQSREYFSVSNEQLNWLSVVFMIVFVLGAPLGMHVFHVLGLKTGVVCGSVLNCSAAALKVVAAVARPGFWCLFLAQFLAACGQLFILEAPPLLSVSWFPEHERTIVTASATAGYAAGTALGLLVPPLVVTSATEMAFVSLFAGQLVLCCVDVLVGTCVVPRRPRTPPNAVAAEMHAEQQNASAEGRRCSPSALLTFVVDSWRDVGRGLFHSWAFAGLLASCSFAVGVFWTLSTFVAEVLGPLGISEAAAGGMGFVSIAVGVPLSLVLCRYVDNTRHYWGPGFAVAATQTLSFAGVVLVASLQDEPNVYLLGFFFTISGAAFTCAIPLLLEFAVELTFPLDEALSGGVMMIGANFVGAVSTLALQTVLGNEPSRETAQRTLGALALLFAVPTIAMWCVPSNRRLRYAFEHNEAH